MALWWKGITRLAILDVGGKPPWVAHEITGYRKRPRLGGRVIVRRAVTACGRTAWLHTWYETKVTDLTKLRPCQHCWKEHWNSRPYGCLRCLFNEGHLWHDNGTRNQEMVSS